MDYSEHLFSDLRALFLITFLVNVWQIQAIGAAYLIFLAAHHLMKNRKANPKKRKEIEWKRQFLLDDRL